MVSGVGDGTAFVLSSIDRSNGRADVPVGIRSNVVQIQSAGPIIQLVVAIAEPQGNRPR